MTAFVDKGNRWVCTIDGEKCPNCYYYGAICLNCLKDYNNGIKLQGAIMTWKEFKASGCNTSTYEDFLKHGCSYKGDLNDNEGDLNDNEGGLNDNEGGLNDNQSNEYHVLFEHEDHFDGCRDNIDHFAMIDFSDEESIDGYRMSNIF